MNNMFQSHFWNVVSVQTISQSVNALVSGFSQVETEIKELRQVGTLADDRFIHVMQVSYP